MAVDFNEETHTYTNTETGEKLISATTILGMYKPEFDRMGNARRVANREGLDISFVLDMWERDKNKACEYGTHIHKVMEDYLTEGKQESEYKKLYESYNKYEKVFDGFRDRHCEKQLFNLEYNIAGTADLIYEKEDSFFIGDFKTNKQFRFYNSYGEYYNPPISHLSVCEFNTYGLQLSLYAHLHEISTGKKCRGLVIFYKSKNDEWYPIRCNYMKCEIENLIQHYIKNCGK